jgi:hypothetical protein
MYLLVSHKLAFSLLVAVAVVVEMLPVVVEPEAFI